MNGFTNCVPVCYYSFWLNYYKKMADLDSGTLCLYLVKTLPVTEIFNSFTHLVIFVCNNMYIISPYLLHYNFQIFHLYELVKC